ncbi:MAG TPA: 16S rRNA (guanine(527)-N(7))-methyltransferase RsmG [Paracoccus sp. (in: a-proteobacteria)]|uniref:16S rRNA (guanine(527)-N(7))-methyltransferase RsmG n=1 Tax=Paracoccus sp. TaxID=267 RepID=UPI002B836319|nr:16S rRNA (guanine(527)-N(7))-methyltransferase RsmG [Paracoccus sp. (in: a-proteobacteria)]HWL57969.1 16S rRNA (guanine(527)-N(7))-methyltransferase RsmG [Paracoccus sp. (in: a-proteobacteria)]
MTVSRETEALQKYASLIRKWNPAINLVAPSTLSEVEIRHIADCRQLVEASREAVGTWADLGSGGGLPGIVVAICRPDLEVSLVESDKRKSAFLRTVTRELALTNVNIVTERIEEAKPLSSANVSARALAPLPLLMSYVARHLVEGGRAWLMKGRNWSSEVDEARKQWQFALRVHQSETDPDAAILEIADICHG